MVGEEDFGEILKFWMSSWGSAKMRGPLVGTPREVGLVEAAARGGDKQIDLLHVSCEWTKFLKQLSEPWPAKKWSKKISAADSLFPLFPASIGKIHFRFFSVVYACFHSANQAETLNKTRHSKRTSNSLKSSDWD